MMRQCVTTLYALVIACEIALLVGLATGTVLPARFLEFSWSLVVGYIIVALPPQRSDRR